MVKHCKIQRNEWNALIKNKYLYEFETDIETYGIDLFHYNFVFKN